MTSSRRASPTTWHGSRTRSGTRTPCATRTARWPGITAPRGAAGPTRPSRPTSRPASSSGTRRRGPSGSATRAPATWCSCPSTTTASASGPPAWRTRTGRAGTRSETWSASWPRRSGAWACASACTTRAGSTGPSRPRPVGSTAEVAASIPQGDYPAYAEAHVRELIERYRPSVLWNDIAWPGRLASLVQLIDHYREAVPDGLVNDRWLCWSPAYRVLDLKPARQLLDRATAKAATRQGGLVPPDSPVGDIRTPEYVSFDHISGSRGSACGASTRASASTATRSRSTSSRAPSCSRWWPTSRRRAATCSSTSGPGARTRRSPTSSSSG